MPEMALLIHPRNTETLEMMLIEFSLLLLLSSEPTAFKKKSLFENNYQSWKLSSHEVS